MPGCVTWGKCLNSLNINSSLRYGRNKFLQERYEDERDNKVIVLSSVPAYSRCLVNVSPTKGNGENKWRVLTREGPQCLKR